MLRRSTADPTRRTTAQYATGTLFRVRRSATTERLPLRGEEKIPLVCDRLVPQLAEGPSRGGQHREAGVLDLGLPHVQQVLVVLGEVEGIEPDVAGARRPIEGRRSLEEREGLQILNQPFCRRRGGGGGGGVQCNR